MPNIKIASFFLYKCKEKTTETGWIYGEEK